MPLDYYGAVRLIRKCGGKFVRHGRRHDIFESPDGQEIQIPRHPGDLSPGVEKDIRNKLGLN